MAKVDEDTQEVLFPELSDSPEHKKILSLARKLRKIRDSRKEALNESKAKEDETQQDLAESMHAAGIEAFRHVDRGVVIEAKIKPHSEKVAVKVSTEDDDEDSDED